MRATLLLLLATAAASAATLRFGVFGLFHPRELQVQPAPASVLIVAGGGRERVLEGSASARFRFPADHAFVTGRNGAPAEFVLSVPGRIRRLYRGRLEVRPSGRELLAIVEMDRETAVASIVAAESPPGAPLEALKAQAVVARSFLVAARGRHRDFDFCDTTHCQFLREPPARGSPAFEAAVETRPLALAYEGRVFAALYSASCGGRTRSLAGAGWRVEDYPYFAVECPYCARKGHRKVLGHRIGLCQNGAAGMAAAGADYRKILAHYFPATSLVSVEPEGRP